MSGYYHGWSQFADDVYLLAVVAAVAMAQPRVPRLLELANDVESNPGPLPHRLVRNHPVNKKVSNFLPCIVYLLVSFLDKVGMRNGKDAVESNGKVEASNGSGLGAAVSVEELRGIIERQSEQITR